MAGNERNDEMVLPPPPRPTEAQSSYRMRALQMKAHARSPLMLYSVVL